MPATRILLARWLPIAAVVTLLTGLAYLVSLHDLRQSADDPQIQMAQDAAAAIAAGAQPEEVLPATRIDVARSLAPFVVVYTSRAEAVASSGLLDGRFPVVPAGVLEHARSHGGHRVTWQPRPGLRIAAVIAPIDGGHLGFVLAGRSLRSVEARIGETSRLIGFAWVLGLAATFILILIIERYLLLRRG